MNLDFKKSKQHFIFKTKYRIKLQTKPICPPPPRSQIHSDCKC